MSIVMCIQEWLTKYTNLLSAHAKFRIFVRV